jgi:hypothetical protein
VAFDYCTAAQVFAYGNSAGNATDPVNEPALMAQICTAVSRAIDSLCDQAFSLETYADQRLTGTIDRDGVLSAHPPVPVMATPTAASYRVGADLTWQTLTLTDVDIDARPHGAVVRFLGNNLLASRFQRVSVRMSYQGGYADASALPADLAWAARAAAWFEYKRRTAPMDQAAIPEMGIVTVPGNWPPFVLRKLDPFRKMVRA